MEAKRSNAPSKKLYKTGGGFEGASHLLFEKAKQFRNNRTDAKKVLWMHLKSGVSGNNYLNKNVVKKIQI